MKTKRLAIAKVLVTAWILWEHEVPASRQSEATWEIVSAKPDYDSCIELSREKAKFRAEVTRGTAIGTATKEGAGVMYQRSIGQPYAGELVIVSYECFPDTVDPRGGGKLLPSPK